MMYDSFIFGFFTALGVISALWLMNIIGMIGRR